MLRTTSQRLIKFVLPVTLSLLMLITVVYPGQAQQIGKIEIEPKTQTDVLLRVLKRNYRMWKRQEITNYRFTFNWNCFCLRDYVRPVAITVRDRSITDIQFVDNEQSIDIATQDRYYTIDALFEWLKEEIMKDPDRVLITYDKRYHFPTMAAFDYDGNLIDEEMQFNIRDFEALQ